MGTRSNQRCNSKTLFVAYFGNAPFKPRPQSNTQLTKNWLLDLTEAFLDQGSNGIDVSRCDFADPCVLVQAGDEVILGQPDMLYRVPALEVQNLVKARHNVASLDPGDDVRAKVNTTDHDVTGFLASVLEDLGQDGGDLTVLRSDGFEVRMGCQIGRHHRNTLGRISVDILCYVELLNVTLAEGFLQRVKTPLRALAATFLMEDVPNEGLVASFELPTVNNRLSGQPTARIQISTGVAEALGLVFGFDVGQRVVAAGDNDTGGFSLVNQWRHGVFTGVAHDHDAVRLSGNRFLELVDHLFGVPACVLLMQFDAESLGCGFCTGGAGQHGSNTPIAAHLHVDDDGFALVAGGFHRGYC